MKTEFVHEAEKQQILEEETEYKNQAIEARKLYNELPEAIEDLIGAYLRDIDLPIDMQEAIVRRVLRELTKKY